MCIVIMERTIKNGRFCIYNGNEFKVYKKYSDIMYTYLCGYTLKIERYSIDECFIDFSDKDEIRNDPVKWAYKIKNDIKKGIPDSR